MNIVSRVIPVIALASALTLGLVSSGCPGGTSQDSVALGRITGVSMDATQSPQVGELAPDFYFETPEGEESSISQLSGRPVLLNFWATRCGPCRDEMPFLQQIYEDWQEEELGLLTVNLQESSSQVSQFMQSFKLSVPVLLDSNGHVAQRYNILYIPTTFFIDKGGVIQKIQVGSFQSQAEIENILSQLD